MDKESNSLDFVYAGDLVGHRDTVTSIVAGIPAGKTNKDVPILISGSRDKTLMIWQIKPQESKIDRERKQKLYGVPLRSLTGHSHFISDISLSSDAASAISSSWDKTLRIWDIKHGRCTKLMTGHNSEVFSVALSNDMRFILSAGCDKDVRLWNTLGDCKYITNQDNHSDWVSVVRFSPSTKNQYFATGGWDGRLKVWDNSTFKIKYSFKAHEGNINSLTISPNGALIATGGQDEVIHVWSYNDMSSPQSTFNAGGIVNAVAFHPQLQWVAAATENSIRVWDLENETTKHAGELKPEFYGDTKAKNKGKAPACSSLAWSPDGKTLYSGHSDGVIRAWDYVERNDE